MIVIKMNAERLELHAPFHPSLSANARPLGGRWLGIDTGWVFPRMQEPELRALCIDLWGVDGTEAAAADTVHIQVTVGRLLVEDGVFSAFNEAIYLVGREIAASLKNRRAARPGRGVKFLVGSPRCKAEDSYFWTTIADGSVFVMADTPRMALGSIARELENHGHMQVVHEAT